MDHQETSQNQRNSEKLIELGVVTDRLETMISKLSEISQNLTVLVTTHTAQIENISHNQIRSQEQINKKIEELEKSIGLTRDLIDIKMTELRKEREKVVGDALDEADRNFVRKESFEPVQRLLYGAVALALSALVGAIINLAVRS